MGLKIKSLFHSEAVSANRKPGQFYAFVIDRFNEPITVQAVSSLNTIIMGIGCSNYDPLLLLFLRFSLNLPLINRLIRLFDRRKREVFGKYHLAALNFFE